MAEHPNVTFVREGYEAFARGDMQWMMDNLDPVIVWHVPGHNQVSGDYQGLNDVLAFFGRVMQMTGGTLRNAVHDIVGNDDHVAVLVTSSAEGPNGGVSYRGVSVFHLRDGRAAEVWGFWEDDAAVDAFWDSLPA